MSDGEMQGVFNMQVPSLTRTDETPTGSKHIENETVKNIPFLFLSL